MNNEKNLVFVKMMLGGLIDHKCMSYSIDTVNDVVVIKCTLPVTAQDYQTMIDKCSNVTKLFTHTNRRGVLMHYVQNVVTISLYDKNLLLMIKKESSFLMAKTQAAINDIKIENLESKREWLREIMYNTEITKQHETRV